MRKLNLQIQRSIRLVSFFSLVILLTNSAFALGVANKLLANKAKAAVTAPTGVQTTVAPTGVPTATSIPPDKCSAAALIAAGLSTCTDSANNVIGLREDKKTQCYVSKVDECPYNQVKVSPPSQNITLVSTGNQIPTAPASQPLKPICGNDDIKLKDVASKCGFGSDDCKWETPECRAALIEAGIGACAVAVKEAKDALTAFRTACDETNLGSPKQCLEEARVCFKSRQEVSDEVDEEEAEEDSMYSRLLAQIGLGEEKKKEIVANKCSVLNAKDYKTEKREQMRALRDAQKEMSELKEKLSDKATETSEKNAKLKKEFGESQIKAQKEMSEAQKQSAEEGQQAEMSIMEAQSNKAAKRSQILQIMAKKAEAIAARAAVLAQFDEALVKSNCELTAEAKTNEAYPIKGLTLGQRNYLMKSAARKLRYQKEFESCKQTAESTKASSYRKMGLEITQADVEIANLNREIEAETTRANNIAIQKNTAISTAGQLQQQMANQSLQDQQAITMQMNEMQQQQMTNQMAASEQMQAAQDRITDAQKEIADLGKAPKGSKSPFEAAGKFTDLAYKVKALEGATCKDEKEKLETAFRNEGLFEMYTDGVYNDKSEDDEDSSSDASAENKGRE